MSDALTAAPQDTGQARAQGGKYLTFKLGGEVYGLEILKVQEIFGMMPVTVVPRMPEFVRGVINLRGRVMPVIDLRTKFGLEAVEDQQKTCIIVVQIQRDDQQEEVTTGVVVDEVSEVLAITEDQIAPSPSFGTNVNTEFILGMGKVDDNVIMLLDIDRVLTDDQADMLQQAARQNQQAQ